VVACCPADVANIGDTVVGPADIGPAVALAHILDGSRAADNRTVVGSPVGADLVVVAVDLERLALVDRVPVVLDWTRLAVVVEMVAPVVAVVARGIRLGLMEAMRTEIEAAGVWMGPSRVAGVVVVAAAAVVVVEEPAVG
jgi:uncharacterized membrane protein YjfL (UPF0719 family)